MGTDTLTPDQLGRFFAKIPSRPTEGCWEWAGPKTDLGYGRLMIEGRSIYAHRLSFVIHKGPIPPGKVVRHRCDNPGCVAPRHLELGTHADNVHDCISRGRSARGTGNGHARLAEQDILAIREALTLPYPGQQRDLARAFDVSKSTITMIKKGQRWAHLSTSGGPLTVPA